VSPPSTSGKKKSEARLEFLSLVKKGPESYGRILFTNKTKVRTVQDLRERGNQGGRKERSRDHKRTRGIAYFHIHPRIR